MALSFLEHSNSAGPSLLLETYLVVSILFDAVRIRTLWLGESKGVIPALFTSCLAIKIVIVVLEESGKKRWLLPSQRTCSTEITEGIFGRTLFVWLDKMMWKGYSNALSVVTLPQIDSQLLSDSLWQRIESEINRG